MDILEQINKTSQHYKDEMEKSFDALNIIIVNNDFTYNDKILWTFNKKTILINANHFKTTPEFIIKRCVYNKMVKIVPNFICDSIYVASFKTERDYILLVN